MADGWGRHLAPATVAWLEAETRSTVVHSEPLVGGMSSTVVRCVLDDGSTVVVRQVDDRDWLAREPGLIAQEAAALVALQSNPLVTPSLVATGDGVLAMTEVSGHMVVDTESVAARVEAMAETAAVIAATPLPSPPLPALLPWRPWVPERIAPPPWGDRGLWGEAIDQYRHGLHERRRPNNEHHDGPVLLHRDFHPLNLLWTDGARLPAVVDWVNACLGHPHAELGHCRWNLAVLVGVEAADRFLEHYLDVACAVPSTSGHPGRSDYDPWWDLASILDKVDGPIGIAGWHAVGRTDLTPDTVNQRTEQFLRSVLVRCQQS